MKDQFVPYEISKLLKELGFNEDCFGWYEIPDGNIVIYYDSRMPLTEEQKKRPSLFKSDNRNSVQPQYLASAPTYQQVKQWLFNVHRIYISVSLNTYFSVRGYIIHPGGLLYSSQIFDSIYNQESSITAENEGIKKAVEYLYKNKK